MTICTMIAWTVALLLLPVLFLAWATETPADRARRWRAAGMTQARIAERLGVSRYQVRKLLAA